MAKADKQEALDKLNAKWEAKGLALAAGATQAVPGAGNPDADILFIGEGPGKAEDEQGVPFVGAAGKFLTELIESIGLTRDDVFIANMVKHRPPENRDPLPEELEAYGPWLAGQINIIEPKLFVTLGRFSMAYLLGESQVISKIHGQPKRNTKGQVVIPMYHPAAALYRGDLRPVLKADFARILKVIELLDRGADPEETEAENAADGVTHDPEKQQALL